MPQPPQLFTSDAPVAVSQPLVATPSQSPKPAAQPPTTQLLEAHAFTVTLGNAQAVAQLPQCCELTVVLTQLPEQSVSPVPQVVVHALDEHTWPPGQALWHAPQLATSPAVSVSQPLAGLPSQSMNPAAHVPSAHTPAVHEAVALAYSHLMPHPPQLSMSVPFVCVSQPFEAIPSQSL
jgi:hypothetical protein